MIYDKGDQIEVTAVGGTSGAPFVVGQMPGVLLNDSDATTNKNILKRNGVFDLSVAAIDANGASAVVAGDILYYTSGDTPKLNKKTTGVRFGYADEAIASGTSTINVAIGY